MLFFTSFSAATGFRSAKRQGVTVNRISFIDGQRWLCHARSQSPLRKLGIVPARPNRYEPRVKKRRVKEYDLMKKPRQQLKQAMVRKHLTS
jgi:hypothetical protein